MHTLSEHIENRLRSQGHLSTQLSSTGTRKIPRGIFLNLPEDHPRYEDLVAVPACLDSVDALAFIGIKEEIAKKILRRFESNLRKVSG